MTNNKIFLKKAYLNADKEIFKHYGEEDEYKDAKVLTENELFMMGANYVLQLFNNWSVSGERNEALKQRENETSEQYQYRLRDEIVEHMVSNRGYAHCLRDE